MIKRTTMAALNKILIYKANLGLRDKKVKPH